MVLIPPMPPHSPISTSTLCSRLPICFLILLLFAVPARGQNQIVESPDGALQLEEPFPNLRFTRPVDFQTPGDGSDRIFVVEQAGVIKVFDNRSDTGSAGAFLDITSRVRDQGNEEGLLGLAFHPEFATNGYFFVNYTASSPRRTVVARYSVDPNDSDRALSSETVILEVAQPYSNHNAGQIVFGSNGYLYITLGDGGGGGDPQDNGEDLSTLLGSILRIDVDGGSQYAIPSGNPFVGNTEGYREEIYAYGLRNPWRISFDSSTGRLWAADVGQNLYEEVNIIEKGGNYGWDVMEGLHCYEPNTGCNETGLTSPVWEYSHDFGNSITGGFVYRGTLAPSLAGRYVFADYGTGRIWALAWDGSDAAVEEIMDTSLAISSFGVDEQQELYVLAFNGRIYRFAEDTVTPPPPPPPPPPPSTIADAPENLRATAGNAEVTLRWEAPSNDGRADITGYAYRHKESGGDLTAYTDIPESGPDQTNARSYTVTGLTNGLEYVFHVQAVNEHGGGLPAEVTVTLPSRVHTESEELPTEVALWGNYPNPFNPETTIRYALPQAGNVRLAVYDLLGHEVAVLVDEPKPAGHHATRFDAGDLPSGAYVYRLEAQDKIMVQIMMLVK